MHIPGQASVDPGVRQLLVSYVTPARGGAECVGAVLWAGVFAEFTLYHNGAYIGGGRTSSAQPTLQLNYGVCPIGLNGNDVLTVMGEHGDPAPQTLFATLLINLL